jgi:hypothetical protein
MADVQVDWKRKEFWFEKLNVVLSWQKDEYQGETDTKSKGFTSEWTRDKEGQVYSYLIEALDTLSEADFDFTDAIHEQAVEVKEEETTTYLVQEQTSRDGLKEPMQQTSLEGLEEPMVLAEAPSTPMESKPLRDIHPLGETCVPLTLEWINQQIRQIDDKAKEGWVPPPYNRIAGADPDKAKTVVAPADYTKVEVAPRKDFYLGVTIQDVELKLYHELLQWYSDVFA